MIALRLLRADIVKQQTQRNGPHHSTERIPRPLVPNNGLEFESSNIVQRNDNPGPSLVWLKQPFHLVEIRTFNSVRGNVDVVHKRFSATAINGNHWANRRDLERRNSYLLFGFERTRDDSFVRSNELDLKLRRVFEGRAESSDQGVRAGPCCLEKTVIRWDNLVTQSAAASGQTQGDESEPALYRSQGGGKSRRYLRSASGILCLRIHGKSKAIPTHRCTSVVILPQTRCATRRNRVPPSQESESKTRSAGYGNGLSLDGRHMLATPRWQL